MKRLFALSLIALVMTCVSPITVTATTYTWSRYNLTFETPEGGMVTHSSATRFEIQWEDMIFTVQLYNKDKSDDKSIKNNLESKALGFNMYDRKLDKMKVKGFKTHYIEGTMPDGSRAVIADLISDKQDLIIEITAQYLFGNREIVDDFIKSFALDKKPGEAKEKEKRKQKVQSKEDSELQEKERAKERELQQKRREHKLFDA